MDPITTYITTFLTADNPQLERIAQEESNRNDIQPSVGQEVGKLLGLLVRLVQAKRVLEFGTCLGYSTICLAEALKTTGGKLTSVEYKPELVQTTRANLEAAGLDHLVDLIHGDAARVIETLEGPFDIILQDSDKGLYPRLLDRSIHLTRMHGLLIADDALFVPKGIPEKFSAPVHTYNELVFADPRLYSTILPIGDGVTLSVKVAE